MTSWMLRKDDGGKQKPVLGHRKGVDNLSFFADAKKEEERLTTNDFLDAEKG